MVEERLKKQLIEIISKHLPDAKIYLYGSRASGDFSMGSDIDLALDNGKPISITDLSSIKSDIEESNIPFFVDVVDIFTNESEINESKLVEDPFRNQVLKTRVLWKN